MVDFIKRVCIALALALFLGILFIGTNSMVANEKEATLIWPTNGTISDTYGARGGTHYGIDIAAPKGTPVVAVADGVVRRSYFSDSYGQVVFITHENGLETVYAHMHTRNVNEGEKVKKGRTIGTVGNTGRSFGDHLHFEVHKGEWNVQKSASFDPLLVLQDEASIDEEEEKKQAEQENIITASSITENETSEDPTRKTIEYIVQAGDSLWQLAERFDVTVSQLKRWNHIEGDLIYIDEPMTIHTWSHAKTYEIAHGDTLSSIAHTYHMTVEELMDINDLTSHLIYPGELLILAN